VDAADYGASVELIVEAARCRRRFSVTALAVHGLMAGVFDKEQRYRLNCFDLVVPDGQPAMGAQLVLWGWPSRPGVWAQSCIGCM
jgi:hypothetical protein